MDHVLPWARTGLDDLVNLVACDAMCNPDNCNSLPVVAHVVRAARREGMTQIASDGRKPATPVHAGETGLRRSGRLPGRPPASDAR